jgi:signal transduction histidine kinase
MAVCRRGGLSERGVSGAEDTLLSPVHRVATGIAAAAPGTPPRRRLFRKYALLVIALVATALLVNSCFDFWFSYRENKAALVRIQQEKAEAAARRIEEFVGEIERQIGWTTHAQWSAGPLDPRRQDYFRLLRQVSGITELSQLDEKGRERLTVSRLKMDVIDSDADFSQSPAFIGAKANRIWFSPVYFRKESEPYMTLAMARDGKVAGVTVAEINLKLIWDVITALKIGQSGYAYVVDEKGRLIAHPDISLVLRDTDLSKLPQVAEALAPASAPGPDAGGDEHAARVAQSIGGRSVLTAHAAIAPVGWQVFVEVPLSEAFAPLYGAALRTAVLLAFGLIAATLVALVLARRMTGPIRAIEAGAERIGAGEFDRRIEIHTGDELEALAEQFNRMGADLQKSYAELEQRVADRTAELSESLDQQTATAEVLEVINASPGDLAPVFEAMLDKATSLCDAAFGILWSFDGELATAAAQHQVPPAFTEFWREPRRPGPDTGPGRMMRGEGAHAIDDVKAMAAYQSGEPLVRAVGDLGGARSIMIAPLRKEEATLGAITIYRQEVRPFTDKQIALLENFAAQAVIAMENARLITETQEALEQQTATAEVLEVINSSPGDLAPVFEAILEKATRLCDFSFSILWSYDGKGGFRAVALNGVPEAYGQYVAENPVAPPPGGQGGLAQMIAGKDFVHFDDIAATDAYQRIPQARALMELAGARTNMIVALRKEGTLLGAISAFRQEVRPFSEKQIALLQNFAAQAVIAMENARLLDELRGRTDDLARSVEELKALSEVGQAVSSTLDLHSVLVTILNRSIALAGADAGVIFRYSRAERAFRFVEAVGWDEATVNHVRDLNVGETVTALGQAVANRAPLQIPDLALRPSNPLRDSAIAAGFHSALIVPLVGADRIMGATILERRAAGEFPEATIRLMQALASQSVLAIQNARLFREIADKSEQLAQASQHKSQFLANMSHELRTPLNAILGYTELMADGIYGELAPRAAGVLERVQNNGKHLLALINDVLDLAKIEAGQLSMELEDYAMPDVVQSVVSATEGMATTKGLKFTADIAPGLPPGRGDARRLSQVLLNLVGNAVKFTDVGEVAIGAMAKNGSFVLTVRDTGPGIAAADQAKIFEEFQQVDNSNTRKKGGTGLGLAISKRMVEMQGGTISVDSELGHGATFRVTLPVRVEEVADELTGELLGAAQ